MRDPDFKLTKETDDYIVLKRGGKYPYTTRERKFLCVGGPEAGNRRAAWHLDGMDYIAFNAADRLNPL